MNSARHDITGAPPTIGRASATGAAAPASPPARRVPRPSWRDPRLVVGVSIVAVCVLLGARLLAGADDTVTVWSARSELAAGTVLSPGDLERSEVRFASTGVARHYLSASDRPPAGTVLTRDVAPGELVPRSALGRGGDEDMAELPVVLASEAVPVGLRAGQVVDVWVTPPGTGSAAPAAVRVLEEVPVVAVPQSAGATLGPTTSRQVVVGVPAEDDGLVARALAALADGTAVLVRRG